MNSNKISLIELMKIVREILNAKTRIGDSTVLEDIVVLEDLINKGENSMFDPIAVDYRLRNKYKMIETVENFIPPKNQTLNRVRKNWYEDMLVHLKNDLVGIYIEVAIDH